VDTIQPITIDGIVNRYDALLFDAYGVLVDAAAALPGAVDLTRRLKAQRKPFFIVTNDASKLPTTAAARFQGCGLAVEADDIITSGSLLATYFAAHDLEGASCLVLGPADSASYVTQAGGRLVAAGEPFDALIVADESGFPLLETLDVALSSLCQAIDAGRSVHLILPNPDLIYPQGGGRFGLAAGSVALIFEAALQARYPSGPKFARLGKPYGAIFAEALHRSGTRNMVMIGDQLETDIKGAADFGIDSVWVTSGVSVNRSPASDVRPTFRLASLENSGVGHQ
jgi:HAD superfamily hydrolase (TIGR01459 family)